MQMKKVIVIPDSFKGTMSSTEICAIVERQIHVHYPEAQVVSVPVADGGEGSVDCFLAALGGDRVTAAVKGPWFEEIEAYYGIAGETAIVEMAAVAGLPLVGERKNPEHTTTYGVGQLIAHAARARKNVVVGLGGSATNDGGTGAAAAAGAVFCDRDGKAFVPTGATLSRIASVETEKLHRLMEGVNIVAMCDIDNPLCGPSGAAAIFGPQKGADAEMVKRLDEGLAHLALVVKRDLGRDILDLPGAGAAGGMGGGMAAFFGAPLQMGIETVLDAVKFDELLAGADAVISGEGRIDAQSLRGKVVIGVARRTQRTGVPLIALVGDIADDIEGIYEAGVTAVFSINRVAVPYEQAKLRSQHDLALTVDNLMRFIAHCAHC